ncbi:hypothetical protein GCM10023231_04460 [Olivibacter ginsenosidimutans]|uniref:LTD domain-containing protein n=1 Tax=Olivibacter ginsenosidimutans TaxID=1176537 RepID=A0ABP9AF58_9SPHI
MHNIGYRKRIAFGLLGCLIVSIWACRSSLENEEMLSAHTDSTSVSTSTEDTWTPWIAISNTADKTLEIYNYNSTTWDASTCNWLFKPTTALGYSANAIQALGDGIGDARLHYTNGFPGKATSAFVVQGGRFLGIGAYIPEGTYVKGQKLWEYIFPTADNPNNHAVELLPNGNIVVAGFGDGTAASPRGNWVRIYNTADPTGASYAQADIIAPHALLLDTIYHRLWVGGEILIGGLAYHGLFAYSIGGTRTNPSITEDTSMRAVLRYGSPTNPTGVADHLKFPHDLAPDYDDDHILIYGDHTGVYRFNKLTKTFTPTPGVSHRYGGTDVLIKSVGKQAVGGKYVVSEVQDPTNHPYETNKVDFYDGNTGAFSFSRTVGGYTIYRARIWTHVYQ